MIGTRVVVGIASGLLILFGLVATVTSLLRGSAETTNVIAGVTCAMYLLCGGPALVAVAQERPNAGWRRAAIIANSAVLSLLGTLGFATAVRLLAQSGESPEARQRASAVLLILAFVTFLNLATIGGLVRLGRLTPRADGKPRRRSSLGAVALGLGVAASLGMGVLGAGALVASVISEPRPDPSPASPTQAARFPADNFQFDLPPRPWVKTPPGTLNADADLMLVNKREDCYFIVIAEVAGQNVDLDTESLRALAVANGESAATTYNAEPASPQTVAGIQGLAWTARARIQSHDITFRYWVGVNNGYAYQLITWGRASNQSQVLAAAAAMQGRFSLINPDSIAQNESAGASRILTAEAYGLTVDLRGTGWNEWTDVRKQNDLAAMGALRPGGGMMVLPVRLGRLEPHDDALARAFFEALDRKYPSPEIKFAGPYEGDGVRGREFTATIASTTSTSFDYRFRILRRGEVACLAAAWQLAGGNPAELGAVLDRVTLEAIPTDDEPPPIPIEDRVRHARIINSVGIFYYGLSQLPSAEQAFREAADFDPADPQIAMNAARTMSEADHKKEAAEFLLPRLASLKDGQQATLFHAMLLSETGRTAAAIDAYREAFAAGPLDAEHLDTYIRLLIDADPAQAESELQRLSSGAAAEHRPLLAAIRRKQDRTEEAIAILRAGLEATPIDTAAAADLIDLYDELGRHTEVIETCDLVKQAGHSSPWTLYTKGAAEMSLDRLPAAKATLLEALALKPGDATIKRLIDVVDHRLGRGDTSAIREPIEPVPVPPEALADLPSAAQDSGALLEHRITSILFEPGKVWRRTERYTARVIDRRGLDAVSSFSFDFSPLAERIYVNALEVRDESGAVVFTGDINAYYIADESTSEHASSERTLHIPVGGMQPGRTLTLTVTIEDRVPPREFEYTDHRFVNWLPARRAALAVYADPSLIRRRASPGVAEIPIQGGILFRMDSRAAWRRESSAADLDTYIPWVRVCAAGSTWEGIARDYLTRIAPRLEPEPAVARLAASLTAGLEGPEDKLRAIAGHVQGAYTYKALSFGPRTRVPPPISETLANRYGDCKDHSFLTHLLLREAGIESRLALVSTDSTLAEDLPSDWQFDHMIVYLPESGRFLDLTDKDTDPLMSPPLHLAGRRALIVEQERPRLVEIPAHPKDASTVESVRDVRLDGRDLLVDETVTLSGIAAGSLRGALRTRDEAEMLALFGRELASIGAEVRSAAAEGVQDPAAPLVVKLGYAVPGALIAAGGAGSGERLAGTIPYFWERRWFGSDFVRDRASPFFFEYENHVKTTVRVHTGPGIVALSPEALNFDLSGELAKATCRAEAADGVVTIRSSLWVGAGLYPAEKYGPHAEFTSRVLGTLEKGLVLERK